MCRPPLVEPSLNVCVCCAPERPGPHREPDAAGLPPGPPARVASHWEAHPVRGSAGLPRPRAHHRRRPQLQRPFLHPHGRGRRHESRRWRRHRRSDTLRSAFRCRFIAAKNLFFISARLSQGKEKVADMRRRTLSRNSKSDHLTIVNAFQVRPRSSVTFCPPCVSRWQLN